MPHALATATPGYGNGAQDPSLDPLLMGPGASQGVGVMAPPIPTSDPRDSDAVYANPYLVSDPPPPALYAPYVATLGVPIGVTIQPATITRTPASGHGNPEFHDPSPQATQDAWRQVAEGAPPIPRSTPEYLYYQAQIRLPNGDYREIIGAYAPRPGDGSGYAGGC